ncbi:MAG: hypothetical protein FWH48_00385 [Oscillospiraceae bacterium]|nr:hypothetical protein [Oscillospiraceae bacterium]
MTQKHKSSPPDTFGQSTHIKKSDAKNPSKATNQNRTAGSRTNYAAHAAHSVMGSGAGAGVLRGRGQVLDAGRYEKRLQEDKPYPNRRKKITTGRDLTTPLARKKTIERANKERAKRANTEQKGIKVKTVSASAKKFPVNAIFGVALVFIFCACYFWSQGIINEQNVQIREWNEKIYKETKNQVFWENEIEKKNDLNFIKTYAVEKLGMVKEESLEKHYISGKRYDRAEVVEASNRAIVDLPGIMSAIMGNAE